MNPDVINSLFETAGAVAMAFNAGELVKDRKVHGIHTVSALFALLWVAWCLPYYWGIHHTLSFIAACGRFLTTLGWVIGIIYLRNKK